MQHMKPQLWVRGRGGGGGGRGGAGIGGAAGDWAAGAPDADGGAGGVDTGAGLGGGGGSGGRVQIETEKQIDTEKQTEKQAEKQVDTRGVGGGAAGEGQRGQRVGCCRAGGRLVSTPLVSKQAGTRGGGEGAAGRLLQSCCRSGSAPCPPCLYRRPGLGCCRAAVRHGWERRALRLLCQGVAAVLLRGWVGGWLLTGAQGRGRGAPHPPAPHPPALHPPALHPPALHPPAPRTCLCWMVLV